MKEEFIIVNKKELTELFESILVNADPSERDTGAILEYVMDFCELHNLQPDHFLMVRSMMEKKNEV